MLWPVRPRKIALLLSFVCVLGLVCSTGRDALVVARESKAEKEYFSQALREFFLLLDRRYLKGKPLEAAQMQQLESALQQVVVKLPQTQAQALLTSLRASVHDVEQLSAVRGEVLRAFEVTLAPVRTPEKKRGAYLYERHCMSCHGAQGKGAGELAQRLDPPPTSFRHAPQRSRLSAHHIYNVLLTGLPSGSMVSLEKVLTKTDLWSLAYYALFLAEGCEDEAAGAQSSSEARPASHSPAVAMEQLALITGKSWSQQHGESSHQQFRELRCQRPFIPPG